MSTMYDFTTDVGLKVMTDVAEVYAFLHKLSLFPEEGYDEEEWMKIAKEVDPDSKIYINWGNKKDTPPLKYAPENLLMLLKYAEQPLGEEGEVRVVFKRDSNPKLRIVHVIDENGRKIGYIRTDQYSFRPYSKWMSHIMADLEISDYEMSQMFNYNNGNSGSAESEEEIVSEETVEESSEE